MAVVVAVSLLRLDGVTRRFGGVQALSGVSFSVEAGEILGLMGANGAGKTTLFNLISGTMRPDSGSIEFDGKPIERLRPDQIARRGIARTYQIVRPFPSMTVLENLMVSAVYGMRRAASLEVAGQQALVILEELELAGRRDDPANALTLAGRKRLEIARALALSPRLLLLDEVLAGLTPVEVERSLIMLRAIQAGHGLTLIFIEHNMRALMTLCSRIVVLHHGERIAVGTPGEIGRDEAVIAAYLGKAR